MPRGTSQDQFKADFILKLEARLCSCFTYSEYIGGYSFHAEPRGGRALFGLRESLLGQQHLHPSNERPREIQTLTAQIAEAWKHADVPLTSPCLHLALDSVGAARRKGPFIIV